MNWDRAFRLAKKFWQWEPHSQGQYDWIVDTAKNKVAACGRRWGKTESTAVQMALYAIAEPGVIQFCVAPTDDQSRTIMNQVSHLLRKLPGSNRFMNEVKSPYHSIQLFPVKSVAQGSIIKARTAGPTGKNLRSNRAHRVVVDEAAYISEDIIMEAVRPMLADYNGQFVAISTPRGRNWFYRLWHEGQSNESRYRSYRFPSSANPYLSRAWLTEEQSRRSERVWQQEYLAGFLENEGQVFRGVQDVIAAPPLVPMSPCSIGIDLAKTTDWTVMLVLDAAGRMVEMQRFHRISWPAQIQKIVEFVSTYPNSVVRVDATGVGDPIYDQLRVALPNHRIHGIRLTSASKEALIENLAMCIETERISITDERQLVHELMCYEFEQTAGLHMRYNAPDGEHDDCVIALALAAWDQRAGKALKPELIAPAGVFESSDEMDDSYF
jgi:phage FluMu gp28-like protein